MLNNVSLIGRLTADPELRQTSRGTAVVNFTLAVDRDRRENGEVVTDFVTCTAWAHNAQFLADYCKKGYRIGVSGRIQESRWEDKDGNSRRDMNVVVDGLYSLTRAQGAPRSEEAADSPERPEDI